MTKETALDAWKRMLTEIDEENWLFVGTINPEMVKWAIKALEEMEDEGGEELLYCRSEGGDRNNPRLQRYDIVGRI